MEIVGALEATIEVIGQILTHYKKIKKVRKELVSLVKLLNLVTPLLEEYLAEMKGNGQLSTGALGWIRRLQTTLKRAEEVVGQVF